MAKTQETKNPYMPDTVKIDKIFRETDDIRTIRVRQQNEALPGQFYELGLFGYGEAPISIASFSKTYLEFCIKDVGSLTHAINELKVGDKIGIRGPFGNNYPLKDMQGKDIVIVGGGTGIASLRGLIKHMENEKDKYRSISLYFGFRTPADILFKKDMDEWKNKFNLNLTVDCKDEAWKGCIGVVTTLLEKAKINKDSSIVIICGPPLMIKFSIMALQKQGISDEQIYVSLERMMKCGIGKCGRCMVKGKYICKDGPVFRHDKAKLLED